MQIDNVTQLRRHVHQSSFHYKDYLMDRLDYDGAIEDPHGFLLYRIRGQECRIGEIYIEPSKRQLGIATELADKVVAIARANGCTYMTCSTYLKGKDDQLSMLSILHYGFIPVAADNNQINYQMNLEGAQ